MANPVTKALDVSDTSLAYASPPSIDCGTRVGLVAPCRIHVTVTFVFRPIIAVPPIPSTLTLTRESWFAISDLTGS